MEKVIKLASWALSSFFLLTLIAQLLQLVNKDLYIWQFMEVTFLMAGVLCLRKIIINGFDLLVLFYLFYIIVNGIFIDYNHHGTLLYYALLCHVFPVMCYFIGRYTKIDIEVILKKMKYPLLFAMVSGIVFYFTHPAWYVVMKDAQINTGASDMTVSEIYRLSSYWGHPYVIGYATFLYSIYITKELFVNKISCRDERKKRYVNCCILFLCMFVLMLAQLRVTIVVYILAFFYIILFGKKESLFLKAKKVLVMLCSFVIFLFLLTTFASSSINYISEHMLGLTEDNAFSDRFEHTSGGLVNYSLWGDGLGRYGFFARTYGRWAIVDQEFQTHAAELGYLGCSILFIIMLITLKRCIARPHYIVENIIMIFFFVSMFGASVLSNSHQFNYIFWYTLGLFWSKTYLKSKYVTKHYFNCF